MHVLFYCHSAVTSHTYSFNGKMVLSDTHSFICTDSVISGTSSFSITEGVISCMCFVHVRHRVIPCLCDSPSMSVLLSLTHALPESQSVRLLCSRVRWVEQALLPSSIVFFVRSAVYLLCVCNVTRATRTTWAAQTTRAMKATWATWAAR